jgi:hypothetical protein
MTDSQLYTKPLACAACGGMCCVSFPGIYHPKDLGAEITEEFIYGLLKTGKFKVNHWDGDFEWEGKSYPNAYFLQPRVMGTLPYEHSYGGTCVNWSLKNGCSLGFKDRPYQCRTLVPHINGVGAEKECKHRPEDKADKENMIASWLPHIHILVNAGERLQEEGLNVMPLRKLG